MSLLFIFIVLLFDTLVTGHKRGTTSIGDRAGAPAPGARPAQSPHCFPVAGGALPAAAPSLLRETLAGSRPGSTRVTPSAATSFLRARPPDTGFTVCDAPRFARAVEGEIRTRITRGCNDYTAGA